MTISSNLYANSIFSEHPIAIYPLDDDVRYVSLISDNERLFASGGWSASANNSASVSFNDSPVLPALSSPFNSDIYSQISASVVSNNTTIEIRSPKLFSFNQLNEDMATFAISCFLYQSSFKVNWYEIGYCYYDYVLQQEVKVLNKVEGKEGVAWINFDFSFLPSEYDSNDLKIILRINLNAGGTPEDYKFIVNGLSIGQWSETFSTTSLGNFPIKNSLGYDCALAYEYGVQESSGYYIIENNKLLARNDGLPLVYGSQFCTKIFSSKNENIPSLILPAKGFLNTLGKYSEYTVEFWMNIKPNMSESKKIFGTLDTDDGIYVNNAFISLKVGKNFASYPVSEWYRPMLVHFSLSKNIASLMINGEQIININFDDDDNISSSQDWIAFYSYLDIENFSLDCVSFYSYIVPPQVATRRFVYGQGTNAPETIAESFDGRNMYVNYSNANYNVNKIYPDVSNWEGGYSDNIKKTKSSLSFPEYTLPEIYIGGRDVNELYTDNKITNYENVAKGGDRVYEITSGQEVYVVHEFRTLGTNSFTLNSPTEVEYLVVGGGGGGGGDNGGGGGGGGFLEGSINLEEGYYELFVGQGGRGGLVNDSATSGEDSYAFGLIAVGGGKGGSGVNLLSNGLYGGSGGGGAGEIGGTGGSGISGQGFSGGTASGGGEISAGAGGGGAAQAGFNNSGIIGGNGGNGKPSSITGEVQYFSGGGGGGNSNDITANEGGGLGGLGGGGNGGSGVAENGEINSGGGGGGAGWNSSIGTGTGGNGGSGIVIVRYKKYKEESGENIFFTFRPDTVIPFTNYIYSPNRDSHGLSEWYCFQSGSATYSIIYENTTIYQKDLNGIVTKVIQATTPQRGTFVINAGYRYWGDKAIFLMSESEQHKLVPTTAAGNKFAWYASRNVSPGKIFVYSPYGKATVRYFDNTTNGINSNPTNTITVNQNSSSDLLSFTSIGWHYISSDIPVVVSITGDSGVDSDPLNPAERIVYNRYDVYKNSVINTVPNSASYVFYGPEPVMSHTIADGSGLNCAQGLGKSYLSDTYSFGNTVSDYTIVCPNTNLITVSYWNGTSWVVWATHSLFGTELSPVRITRDGTNGPNAEASLITGASTNMANGATLWKWEGTDKFYIGINDSSDDEMSLYGWMRNNYIRKDTYSERGIKWSEPGYIYFDSLGIIDSLSAIYGVFSTQSIVKKSTLALFTRSDTTDQFHIYLENGIIYYSFNDEVIYSEQIGSPGYDYYNYSYYGGQYDYNNSYGYYYFDTFDSEYSFAFGIKIKDFINNYGYLVKKFFQSPNNLQAYFGGNGENTFEGKIHSIGFCNSTNILEITELFNDDGIVDVFEYEDLLNHFATYTLKPLIRFNQFFFDISVSSLWEEYFPLSKFAGYIKNYEGERFYDIDYLQINLGYPSIYEVIDKLITRFNWNYVQLFLEYNFPARRTYDFLNNPNLSTYNNYEELKIKKEIEKFLNTEESSLRSYITFQLLSEGANEPLSSFPYTRELVESKYIDVALEDDPNNPLRPYLTKFEFVDNTVVFPPRYINFEEVAMVFHFILKHEGIISNPLFIRDFEIISRVLDYNSFNALGSEDGSTFYPYVKSGVFYENKSKNPMTIGKKRSPYLYVTENSGVKLLGKQTIEKEYGIAIQVNKEKVENYDVNAIQLWIKSDKKQFSTIEYPLFDIEALGKKIEFVVKTDPSGKRGMITARDKNTRILESGIVYYQNGVRVKTPMIEYNEWNSLGILFDKTLSFSQYTGYINLFRGAAFNNVSYYQTSGLGKTIELVTRPWRKVLTEDEITNINWASWYVSEDTLTQTRTNLANNPSFESNLNNWSANGASTTIERISTDYKFGSYALKCTTGSQNDSGVLFANASGERMPINPNTEYTISVYLKIPNGSPNKTLRLIIRQYTQVTGGSPLATKSQIPFTFSSSDGWVRVPYTFTSDVLANALGIEINQETGNQDGDIFYVDGLLVEDTSAMSTKVNKYFDGGFSSAGDLFESLVWNGTVNNSTSTAVYYVPSNNYRQWVDIYAISENIIYELNPGDIYNAFVGLNRFVIDDNTSLVLDADSVNLISDARWSRFTDVPA